MLRWARPRPSASPAGAAPLLPQLCKDRTGLLVDPDAPQPQTWYTPRVSVSGLPSTGAAASWPTAEQLLGQLKSRSCSPVGAADIEDDAVALLSTGGWAAQKRGPGVSVAIPVPFAWSCGASHACVAPGVNSPTRCQPHTSDHSPLPSLHPPAGLFRNVRLVVKPPSTACAPAFALRSGALQTMAPLESIEFVVAPRQLPAIQKLSVEAEGGAEAPTEETVAAAQAAAAAAGAGVAAYLAARAVLLKGLPAGVDVAFEGVESGAPTAVVRPVPAGALRDAGRGGG